MNAKKFSLIAIFFFFITCIFFYKTVLHGFIPFPGDLLISEYNPWKAYSYLGYNPGSFPSKAQYFDILRQIYPWRTLVIFQIIHGQLPLWNPYNFSGAPLLANFQSAVFYPLTFFYFIFKQKIGWTILLFLQPFLAGIFTYIFAKEIKISKYGSVIASVSYAFCSFMMVWFEYNTLGQVILWLPLLLFLTEKLLTKKNWWIITLFLFAFASAGFAGHPQIFFYEISFVFVYEIFRIFTLNTSKLQQIVFFVFLYVIGFGLLAIQYVPGFELILNAARSNHDYATIMNKILIQPWQTIMLFIPDFFGNPATRNYWPQDTYVGKVLSIGIVPLVFSFFSISNRKNIYVKFFLLFSILIFIFVSANPVTAVLYSLPVSFFSSSAPTLSVFLFCFCLSILSGFGFDRVTTAKTHKFFYWLAIPVLVFAVALSSIFLEPHLHLFLGIIHAKLAFKNMLLSGGLFVSTSLLSYMLWKKKSWLPILFTLILLLQLVDAWRFFTKFNPFVPQQLVFPTAKVITFLQKQNSLNRFWSFGAASIEANFATQEYIYSPNGYDPLYPKWYGEFIQSSTTGNVITTFTDQTRSDAVIAPSDAKNFAQNPFRQKVLNLLGVSYIIDTLSNASTQETFPPTIYQKIYQDSAFSIYKNNTAMPRIFLTSSYEIYNSPKEFSQKFFNSSFPLSTILLEKPIDMQLSRGEATVRVLSYLPNHIILRTNASGSKLLFLSDTYYPGWKAFVDNKETPILKADYAFRAIIIPSGVHQVIFTFDSPSFKIGSVVSVLSLLLAAGVIIYFATAKRHGKK